MRFPFTPVPWVSVFASAVAVTAAALPGCGGGSSDSDLADTSGQAGGDGGAATGNGAATVVGAAGGTVTSADGNVTLTIPSGALATDVPIQIVPIASPSAGPVGTVYDFEPSGTEFAAPASVTFRNGAASGTSGADGGNASAADDEAADVTIATYSGTTWLSAPSSWTGGAIGAAIPHFSTWAVVSNIAVGGSVTGDRRAVSLVKPPAAPPVATVLPAIYTSADVAGSAPRAEAMTTTVTNGVTTVTSDAADTTRIQAALNACPPNEAVALEAANGKNVFLTGALTIKDKVSLVLGAGVTLYASRTPFRYRYPNNPEVAISTPGMCGTDGNASGFSGGCKPLLLFSATQTATPSTPTNGALAHSGLYGAGVIDGQGGQPVLGSSKTWWQLATAATSSAHQNNPFLVYVSGRTNFDLVGVTLRNAPQIHVVTNLTAGFTAWGVLVDTPSDSVARNTDGIDLVDTWDGTITQSYIRDGDDDIAFKGTLYGSGVSQPVQNITVASNHLYWGHGMSIGGETRTGVSSVAVSGLTMDGSGMPGGAVNGLQIKSNDELGGKVTSVSYSDVCLKDVTYPLRFYTTYNPDNSATPGTYIPSYTKISLSNVQIFGGSASSSYDNVVFQGYSKDAPLGLSLSNVVLDYVNKSRIVQANAEISESKENVTTDKAANGSPSCDMSFPAFPASTPAGPSTQRIWGFDDALLTAANGQCDPINAPFTVYCQSAISRACQQIGYAAGYGPAEIGSGVLYGTCLDSSIAAIDSAPWTALQSSGCTETNARGAACDLAIQASCAALYGAGAGGAGIVEYNASTAYFTCVRPVAAIKQGDNVDHLSSAYGLSCTAADTASSGCTASYKRDCQAKGYSSGFGPTIVPIAGGPKVKYDCVP